jgi:hypothetical protein
MTVTINTIGGEKPVKRLYNVERLVDKGDSTLEVWNAFGGAVQSYSRIQSVIVVPERAEEQEKE